MESDFSGSDYGLGMLHGRPIIGVQRGRGRAFAASVSRTASNMAVSSSSSVTTLADDDTYKTNLGRVIKNTLNCGNLLDTSTTTNTIPMATMENTEDILTPISTAADLMNTSSYLAHTSEHADRSLTQPSVDVQRTPTKASDISRTVANILPPTQFDFPLATNPVANLFNLPQPTAADIANASMVSNRSKPLDTISNTDIGSTTTAAVSKEPQPVGTAQPTANGTSEAAKLTVPPGSSGWSDDEEEKQQQNKPPFITTTTTPTLTAPKRNYGGAGRGDNFGRGGGTAGGQSSGRDTTNDNVGKNDFGDSTGGSRFGSGGVARGFPSNRGGGSSSSGAAIRRFGRGGTFGTTENISRNNGRGGGDSSGSRPFGCDGGSSRGFSRDGLNNQKSDFGSGEGDRGGGGRSRGFNRNSENDQGRDFVGSRGGSGFSRGDGANDESRGVGSGGRSGGLGFGRGSRGGFQSSGDQGNIGSGSGGFGRSGEFGSSSGDQGRDFGDDGKGGRGGFSRGNDQGDRGGDGGSRGFFYGFDNGGGGDRGFERSSGDRPSFTRGDRFTFQRDDGDRDRDDAEQRNAERAARFDRREEVFRSMRRDRVPHADGNGKPTPNGEPRLIGYIPPTRAIDSIFEEDSRNADNYRIVADDDEDVAPDFMKDVTVSVRSHAVLRTIDTWADANLEPKLLKNITERSKYVRPRKIQASCIPYVLDGSDVMAHAETGSGKTAAFMIPVINQLMKMERRRKPLSGPMPYAIVIEPTRELCDQVWSQGRKLAYETGLIVARAYGNYDRRSNLRELMMGCDILCATPGRLADFVLDGLVSVKKLKFLIMDEADRLLEASFLSQINGVVLLTDFPTVENRQSLLFSATFPPEVQQLCRDVLKPNSMFLSIKKSNEAERANHKIIQTFVNVEYTRKKEMLLEILSGRVEQSNVPQNVKRTLVFVSRKSDTDLLSLYLSQQSGSGLRANSINGDRSQQQREEALADFRDNKIQVLVVTDVCARGIDIKDMDHVINFDMPSDPVTYIHRIGRTGRLKHGFATSFIDVNNQLDVSLIPSLVKIIRDAEQDPPQFMKDLLVASKLNVDDPVSHDFGTTTGFVAGGAVKTAADNADRSTVMNIPVPAAAADF